jgi:hypothetical protein
MLFRKGTSDGKPAASIVLLAARRGQLSQKLFPIAFSRNCRVKTEKRERRGLPQRRFSGKRPGWQAAKTDCVASGR